MRVMSLRQLKGKIIVYFLSRDGFIRVTFQHMENKAQVEANHWYHVPASWLKVELPRREFKLSKERKRESWLPTDLPVSLSRSDQNLTCRTRFTTSARHPRVHTSYIYTFTSTYDVRIHILYWHIISHGSPRYQTIYKRPIRGTEPPLPIILLSWS